MWFGKNFIIGAGEVLWIGQKVVQSKYVLTYFVWWLQYQWNEMMYVLK